MLQSLSSLQDVQKLYTWFTEMRANQPVWLDPASGCWHVFRYDDVLRVSTEHKRFSSERPPALSRLRFRNRLSDTPSLIAMDPPQHRQYRNLVSSAFTPRALEPLGGRIHTIVQDLLQRVLPNGQMDIVADLAYPFPTTVIAELLGVPVTDRPVFKGWADTLFAQQLSDAEIFTTTNIDQLPGVQESNRVTDEMVAYFTTMLNVRRQHPREDMMSQLLAAEIEGEKLSIDQVVSFCILLLLAGHVTTTTLLGQAIRCFDEHPESMQRLRAQPELMPGAIEEILRYASPIWRLIRVTTEEVPIGDVSLPPGAIVFAWLSSANRDETQFPAPETFDITRTPNRHVAFGHGIHFCVGAPLARLETAIALPMILEQLPQLRLDQSVPLELLGSRTLFGFKRLPVTFKPQKILQKSGHKA